MTTITRQKWMSLTLLMCGALVMLTVGTLFVAPTGPGSARPVFVFLAAYSAIALALVPKRLRWISALMLAVGVVGVLYATLEKQRFKEGLQRRMDRTTGRKDETEDETKTGPVSMLVKVHTLSRLGGTLRR